MRRRNIRLGAITLTALITSISLVAAQVNTSAPPTANSATPPYVPVFRSEASVVSLGVTVTDKTQHQIRGLAKEDFAIFEDGRPQELRYFAADPTPLDLAILLDTSGSMRDTLRDAQDAALELAAALRPGDRASLIEVKRGMNVRQPLSDDAAGLVRAIRSTTPGGATSLFEAIYVTLRTLQRAGSANAVRRHALVLLSDGNDNTSMIKYDDVLDLVQRSGVMVYAVSLRIQDDKERSRHPQPMSRLLMGDTVNGDFVLRSLAEKTGGRAFFGLTGKELAQTCQRIAGELANQYSLGYVSSNPRNDGQYRLVSVRVVSASGVQTRTRPGYFATPATSRTASSR